LERAIYISPFDMGLHTRLANLYAEVSEWGKAIRERKAVLALDPVDRADALYQLALAYFQSGDLANARRTVLRALEDAPSFERAQDLLLEIRAASPESTQ
jgi:tetratricopeptide (TPR) repeat protein